jgi:CRP-like cAMP-binding protein
VVSGVRVRDQLSCCAGSEMAHESDGQASLRRLRSETGEAIQMTESEPTEFDAATFLAKAGLGRRIIAVKARQLFFAQGSNADSVFYLQKGRVRITVVSERGKEATITLLSAGDFIVSVRATAFFHRGGNAVEV